jgi:hypothetical protein
MILSLAVDRAVNDRPDNLDYCLGRADFEKGVWECATTISYDSEALDNEGKISYKIPNNGIYAVIYNP